MTEKEKVSLCYTIKTYREVDVQIRIFLTSTLVSDEWQGSSLGRRCTPGENFPGTHFTGSWICSRTGLNVAERRKILPLPGLELRLEVTKYLLAVP
jgi:hypothetical protein